MTAPTGFRSVREEHAPRIVVGDPVTVVLWRGLDFFSTPPWGARAGAEILREFCPGARTVWEPACGMGTMAGPFREYWPDVRASDIHPFGFGDVLDFLAPYDGPLADIIATNPPFKHAAEFIHLALQRARMGVAVLCRTSFIETNERYPLLFAGPHPMTLFCPFAERVPMRLGPWSHLSINPKTGKLKSTSSATSYSWFFFLKGRDPMAPRGIPPGTRDRLWLRDDVQKYGTLLDLPLLAADA